MFWEFFWLFLCELDLLDSFANFFGKPCQKIYITKLKEKKKKKKTLVDDELAACSLGSASCK
jgi:hypothetical protein